MIPTELVLHGYIVKRKTPTKYPKTGSRTSHSVLLRYCWWPIICEIRCLVIPVSMKSSLNDDSNRTCLAWVYCQAQNPNKVPKDWIKDQSLSSAPILLVANHM